MKEEQYETGSWNLFQQKVNEAGIYVFIHADLTDTIKHVLFHAGNTTVSAFVQLMNMGGYEIYWQSTSNEIEEDVATLKHIMNKRK